MSCGMTSPNGRRVFGVLNLWPLLRAGETQFVFGSVLKSIKLVDKTNLVLFSSYCFIRTGHMSKLAFGEWSRS